MMKTPLRRYTDAEAVAAVATGDDYVKNTGDKINGELNIENGTNERTFIFHGWDNKINARNGGIWAGNSWYNYEGARMGWLGATLIGGKGQLEYYLYGGGSDGVRLRIAYDYTEFAKPIYLDTVKSGATQAGAGAVANEVWKTSGHASLPDNVLMIGV